MSKSLEYMIKRSKDKTTCNIPEVGWSEDGVVDILNFMKQILEEEFFETMDSTGFDYTIKHKDENDNEVNLHSRIDFNKNANFNYFASNYIVHDGTTYFIHSSMCDIIRKVLTRETFNRDILTDEIIKNIHQYKVTYTLGDIVIQEDFGMKGINGRIMMGESNWICLPIEYKIEKL